MTPIERRAAEAAAKARHQAVALDFLHTALTQTRLPYRDIGDDVRSWEHRQGNALLRVEAGAVFDPRTREYRPVGVPFGEKARLVLIHVTGEALRTGDPVVEVEDSLTAFVRELGLPLDGRTIGTVREQLARISAATVRLAYFADDHATQFNSRLVAKLGLWAPKEPGERGPWPGKVRLSEEFFASIQGHAVPLSRPAIRALAPSAMALDTYCWLAGRLHRVPPWVPQAVSWAALHAQFGGGYARERAFRAKFMTTLRAVLAAYPDARIEATDNGLLLRRSRPPIAPRAWR